MKLSTVYILYYSIYFYKFFAVAEYLYKTVYMLGYRHVNPPPLKLWRGKAKSMKNQANHSKKILKILAEKPAISLETLRQAGDPKTSYALARSARNLVEAGFAEMRDSDNQSYLRLTRKGKQKLHSLTLEASGMPVPAAWDGMWRIIILDLAEERKSEREALRYLLKKANFVPVKNSVWVSPFPYEHLFTNIKKDLGLSTELMIIVTDKLDPDTAQAFLDSVKHN